MPRSCCKRLSKHSFEITFRGVIITLFRQLNYFRAAMPTTCRFVSFDERAQLRIGVVKRERPRHDPEPVEAVATRTREV